MFYSESFIAQPQSMSTDDGAEEDVDEKSDWSLGATTQLGKRRDLLMSTSRLHPVHRNRPQLEPNLNSPVSSVLR